MRYMPLVFLALLVLELSGRSAHGQDERERADRQAKMIAAAVDRAMVPKMEEIAALILAERAELLSAIVDERSQSVSAIADNIEQSLEKIEDAAESTPAASQSSDGELLALIRAGKLRATCTKREARYVASVKLGSASAYESVLYKPLHGGKSQLDEDDYAFLPESLSRNVIGVGGWCEEYQLEIIE